MTSESTGLRDTVVIGAGQAGLAVSHHLGLGAVGHVVLEQGRVGETWRSQRWDSFALNTPGWASRLPGDDAGAGPADEFAPRDAFAAYLQRYAEHRHLPIRTGVTVTAVEHAAAGGFIVRTGAMDPIATRTVVVASGSQRLPRMPAVAAALPASVTQVHSVAYRNPAQLPPGAVLVVGSAQSGGQIVEELLDAGRTVYLSTSRVPRVRRRYRGLDCFAWLVDTGFLDQTIATLPNPAMEFVPQPIISGLGRSGHTVSLQFLAERGARLLGHVTGVADGRLVLADNLGANIAWADARASEMLGMFDAWIARNGVNAPPREPDVADDPHPNPGAVHAAEALDFDAAGISTVIWTTGVRGEFNWLPPAAVAADGRPIHAEGVSPLPGLYFAGVPWQRNRASGIIKGAGEDAALLVARITEHLAAR